MERLEAAKDIERSNVKSVENDSFNIISGKRTYNVTLGSEDRFPCCECSDWDEHHMPCKHMFAAMKRNGEIDWEQISPLYMNSAYCTIDDLACATNKIPTDDNTGPTDLEDEYENVSNIPADDGTDLTDVQDETDSVNVNKVENEQRIARDVIKKLTSMTYDITDTLTLRKIQNSVNILIKEVDVRSTISSSKYVPLRKRRSLRKHSKRCGVKARNLKKHSKLEIPKDVPVYDHTSSCDKEGQLFEDVSVPVIPCLPEDCIPENHPELCQEVERMWKSRSEQLEPRSVGPYPLTAQSFWCTNNLLCDEVIDAFLHEVVGRYQGQKVYHLNCITMTSIFEAQQEIHRCLRRVPSLMMYDTIIGAYNEAGCHWCLIIILPKERKLLYINPLGTLDVLEQDIVLKWFNFLKSRYDEGIDSVLPGEWDMETPCHAKQSDGSSCGIYVLKLAENYLAGRTLAFEWSKEEVQHARLSLAVFLLSVSRSTAAVCVEEDTANCEDSNQDRTSADDKDEKTYKLRGMRRLNRKRSSFVYPEVKVEPKKIKLYCLCQQPNDKKRFMIFCDFCLEWFHLECLGIEKKDIPKKGMPFICTQCSVFSVPDVLKPSLDDDEEEEELETNFFIDTNTLCKHMSAAVIRVKCIVSNKSQKRKEPWMARHLLYRNGKMTKSNGYGYAVFSQRAVECARFYVKKMFLKNEYRSLFHYEGTVTGMSDQKLVQHFKSDKHTPLAEMYIDQVLVPEALCCVIQDFTGWDYQYCDEQCSVVLQASKLQALKDGFKMSKGKKAELLQKLEPNETVE
ncbi:uncharacterized protein LOC123544416 isoform X2 [Mercenaria mercenaria]|nr:uncharacterized protein LOC123544416 isoform X2 [Mercenaria mercenaria]